MPNVIETAFVAVNISIAGQDCEQEAQVKFVRSPAFAATVDQGVHVQAAERENAEIRGVLVLGNEDLYGARKEYDISHLLTDDQLQAVVSDVLEQR